MVGRPTLARRRARRGATPIIAVIFLVAMTIVAGAVLWTFRIPLPSTPPQIWYQTVSPFPTEAYADGSDCKNVGSGANQTQVCEPLNAVDIVVTHSQPSGMLLSSLQLYFLCEGTVYLSGPVSSLEWIPGSTGTIGGGGNGIPALGNCGTYTPPTAAFNRFMYFDQLTPGDQFLEPGDQFIIFAQGFSPPACPFAPSTSNICWLTASEQATVQASTTFPSTCPSPSYAGGDNPASNGSYGLNGCDDDYHGVPTSSCYTVVNACAVEIAYRTGQESLALSLPMFDLYSPNPG